MYKNLNLAHVLALDLDLVANLTRKDLTKIRKNAESTLNQIIQAPIIEAEAAHLKRKTKVTASIIKKTRKRLKETWLGKVVLNEEPLLHLGIKKKLQIKPKAKNESLQVSTQELRKKKLRRVM